MWTEKHLLDLEMVSTEVMAEHVGRVYLDQSQSELPVEVRYLDVTGEPRSVEVTPA